MMKRSKLVARWNRFWFRPVDARPMALYRILYSALLLVQLGILWPDRMVWFGIDGLVPLDSSPLLTNNVFFNFFYFLPDNRWINIFFVVYGCMVFRLLIGLGTRRAAVFVWLGLISLHHRDPLFLTSGDTLLRVCGFWLMFSDSGSAWSVDQYLGVRRHRIPAWPQRMIQLQLSLVYVSTVLWKLGGSLWRNGTAVWYVLQLKSLTRNPLSWISQSLVLIRLATWGTLLAEGALGTLMWVRRLRWPIIGVGVMLHLGMEYSLNIPLFQWIMLSTYVVFLDGPAFRFLSKRLRRLTERSVKAAAPPPASPDLPLLPPTDQPSL